jgi:hypothetical protein
VELDEVLENDEDEALDVAVVVVSELEEVDPRAF